MKSIRLSVVLLGCILTWTARGGDWITYDPKTGPGAGKHLVFLTGDEEYRSEEGLPMLAKILSQRHGFKCTVLFALDEDGTINPNNNKSAPGSELLDSADGIIMLLRFRQWPDDAMKHLLGAVQRGVPIIGLRTATHSFRFPAASTSLYKQYSDKGTNSFGKKIFGEEWINHWGWNGQGATRGVIDPSAKSDPVLRGVTDIFGDTGVYEVYPTPDSMILVRGLVLKGMKPTDPPAETNKRRRTDPPGEPAKPINELPMPIVWTRTPTNEFGTVNRVLCTTMGAATDLQSEGLRRLIVNGAYWGLGLEVPAMADVRYADDYQPSAYSANRFRRGITPADHALGQVLPQRKTTSSTQPPAKLPPGGQ